MTTRWILVTMATVGVSCSDGDADPKTPAPDATASTDTTPDTAEPDVPDTPPPEPDPIVAQFRADELRVREAGDGFDLDQDGDIDNALANLFEEQFIADLLGGDPNTWITKQVEDGDLNLLFDLGALHDLADDPALTIDILLGEPVGADAVDGYLVQCDSLTEAGDAASHFDNVTMTAGKLQGGPGEFRFKMTFAQDTELVFRDARIAATLSEDGSTLTNGMIGGTLVLSELEAVLANDPEVGGEFLVLVMGYLKSVADLDLDDDGETDAMTAAFGFKAGATAIDRESPCHE